MDPYTSPENRERAAAAVRAANAELTGRERDGVRVDWVWHYGAVHIHTAHLVVWIMLSGRPDDELPEWLAITPDLLGTTTSRAADAAWLLDLRQVVVDAFAEQGWPEAERVRVCAESTHRAGSNGGFLYFK